MIFYYNGTTDRFNLSFYYDEELLNKLKLSFVNYSWNKKSRTWELPATEANYHALYKVFPGAHPDESFNQWYKSFLLNSELRKMKEGKDLEDALKYQFKTQPYKHQLDAFHKAILLKSGALFFECGLGKSKTALDIAAFFIEQRQVSKVLVLVPLSVTATWRQEIPKHTHLTDKDFVLLTHGSVKSRALLLGKTNAQIYVANYDAVSAMLPALINKKFDMLICDESTYIKSLKAKRTKAVFALARDIKHKWVLTGTPFGQRVMDVYSQLRLVAPGEFAESSFSFRNRYCIMGGFQQHEVIGYKNMPELYERMAKTCMIARKADCLDLPPKVYETRMCQMTGEQNRHYKELAEFLITIVEDKEIQTPAVLSQMNKFAQLTSGFIIVPKNSREIEQDIGSIKKLHPTGCSGFDVIDTNKTIVFKENPKLDLLKDTLEEVSGKVVIFCHYHQDVKNITAVLPKNSYVVFTGDQKEEERSKAIDEFTKNPLTMYMVATSAGGYGLNLQVAQTVVFYSHEWSVEKRQQAEDRVHRSGQTGAVTVIDLVCENSIDGYILQACKEKRDFTSMLMGNINTILKVWKGNKEEE